MLNPNGLDFTDINLCKLLIYVRYELINKTEQGFDLHIHYQNDMKLASNPWENFLLVPVEPLSRE